MRTSTSAVSSSFGCTDMARFAIDIASPLEDLDRSILQRLRREIVPHFHVHPRQVVQTLRHVGMVGPQSLFPDSERALEERQDDGIVQRTLVSSDYFRETVESCRESRI